MEILENFFDDKIVVGLYKKNTRAISFLEKNNFLITQIEDDYLFLSKRI
jgi:ribosomal protein S18 acetylase RimI-like enzyme